jgi:hypothetical protein
MREEMSPSTHTNKEAAPYPQRTVEIVRPISMDE